MPQTETSPLVDNSESELQAMPPSDLTLSGADSIEPSGNPIEDLKTSVLGDPTKPPATPQYKSYDDMVGSVVGRAQMTTPLSRFDFLTPKQVPYEQARKFEGTDYGYRYGVDNEDLAGKMDNGFFSNLAQGVGRLGVGVVTKTGEGLGFISGLLNPSNWDSDIINKAADNGISQIFEQLDEKVKQDWLPVYQEAADRDKGFWNRMFTDGDFWTNDVVDGLAFLVSAYVPGMALSKLGLGVKAAQALSGLRVGVGSAEAAVEGAAMAENYLSKAQSLFANNVDRFNTWALSVSSEAMFEAKGVRDNVINSLTYDQFGGLKINPETGVPYTDEEKRKVAGAAAHNTFLMNAALLSGTNAMEMKWLGLGSKTGSLKGVLPTSSLDEVLKVQTATSGVGKFLNGKMGAFIKGAAEGIITEGYVEENAQLAIQRMNEHYGAKGTLKETLPGVTDVLKQYGKQTLASLTGADPEAASNIGIGGILGGIGGGRGGMRELKEDDLRTSSAVDAYNIARENFLKYGNIYKTEEIQTKDVNGNPITITKAVVDKNNVPVIDEEKLKNVTTNYQSILSQVDESLVVTDKVKQDILRDDAWAKYVVAHINAGIEDTIIPKLNAVAKSDPGNLVKLGFMPDKTTNQQIDKYKTLTASIIRQNEILNSDIIFGADELDKGRKNKMIELASQQAVYKQMLNKTQEDMTEARNQFLDNKNTSLSDGLVDQLNEYQHRINSQKQFIEDLSKEGVDKLQIEVAKDVLEQIEEDLATLKKDNSETLKTIKSGKTGFYRYEKANRNNKVLSQQYDKKLKLKGELENHTLGLGVEWSKYADTINGRKNFLRYSENDVLAPVIQNAVEEAKKTAKEAAVQNAEKIKAAPVFTVKFKNEEGKDDSFDFRKGAVYIRDLGKGKQEKAALINIIDEGKTAVVKIDDAETESFIPVEQLAKYLKDNKFKETFPGVEEETPEKKKAVKKASKEDNGDDIDELDDSEKPSKLSSVGKKPKFEVVGFRKTFGRQYIDDDDTIPNKENGTDRFYAFTAKHNVTRRGYVLQVVTKDNDEFKITQKDFPDDIKVIVAKKTMVGDTPVYTYVDENNEEIPEGKATNKNLIYRSLPDINNWTVERVRQDYTVDKDTTDEQIQKVIDNEKEYYKNLIERAKEGTVYLNALGTSPGIQRVQYTSAIDKDGDQEVAKNIAEGRVIVKNPDWSDLRSISNPEVNIGLRVSTGKGVIMSGIGPGRLVMQEYTIDENGNKISGDKITRVFNRELLDDEKENVINGLIRLSELYIKKYGFNAKTKFKSKRKLSIADQADYDLLYQYLKGIINFSRPQKGKVTNKYIWIESGLHRGSLKINFKKDDILKHKEDLTKGLMHNVNNKYLQDNNPFTTIKFVKGQVVPDTEYATYEQYLMSKRDDKSAPPVYSSLPLYNSETPQRTQAYIMWRDPAVEDVEDDVFKASNKVKKIKAQPKTKEEEIDDFINYETKSIEVNGYTISYKVQSGGIVINIKKGNFSKDSKPFKSKQDILAERNNIIISIAQQTKYQYGKNADLKSKAAAALAAKKQTTDPKAQIENLTKLKGELTSAKTIEDVSSTVEKIINTNDLEAEYVKFQNEYIANNTAEIETMTKAATSQEDAIAKLLQLTVPKFIDKKIAELSGKKQETITPAPIVPGTPGRYYTIEDAVTNAVAKDGKLSAAVYEKNATTGEERLAFEATVDIPNGNLNAAKNNLIKALLANIKVDDEEAPFRLALDEMQGTEDFKKLSDFIKDKLPQLSVIKTARLIAGKAWGMFANNSIYVYENAEIGTGYHEAFEAVWNSYLTDDEQKELIDEFKSREGTFYNPFTRKTKQHSEASDYDAREMMGEEFRDVILNNTFKKNVGTKIKNFFQGLWNLIRKLLGLSVKERKELDSKINALYKKIQAGKFRNAIALREISVDDGVFRSIGDFTQKETTDILEGLNYHFFTELFSQGNNIDSILGRLTKVEANKLLNDLWNNATEKVKKDLKIVSSIAVTRLEAYKDDFYKEFKSSLDRYGVTFSEVEVGENDVTDTLGIRDSISIDPRSMTNTNVQLLLASLPMINYKNGKRVLERNDMNQPRLVEADRLHTILLNELSNTVSIIDENGSRKNILDQMIAKLDKKYKRADGSYKDNFGWVRNLKLRLKYEDAAGTKIDSSTLNQDDMLLRVSFTKSFSNAKFQPEKLIISDDGYIYNANPLINANETRIRTNWSNNLKSSIQNKQINFLRIDPSGKMVINRSVPQYRDLIDNLDDSDFNLLTSLDVLSKLGIKFSAELNDILPYANDLRENAMQILNLIKSGEINDMADLYGKSVIGGRINTLVTIESKFSTEDNILNYLNAEGESQYSVGIPSLLTSTINTINSVAFLEELVQTCPWLGFIDEEDGQPVLYSYQTNSELLRPGGVLFDDKGKRRKAAKLSFHVISGFGVSDVDGVNTSKLQFPERVANKIHYLIKGLDNKKTANAIVFSVINSDKSTEYGIGMPRKMMVTKENVEDLLLRGGTKIIDKYIDQLSDEMYAAYIQKLAPSNIQYYRDDVSKLGHFRDILGKDLIDKFNNQVLSEDAVYEDHEDFIKDNKKQITKKISDYITNKIDETAEFLKDLDLFTKPNSFVSDLHITNGIDNDLLDTVLSNTNRIKYKTNTGFGAEQEDRSGYNDNQIKLLAGILAINEELMIAEQHKLIYGHPAMYKDLAKRANGATSTKEAVVEDSDVIQWMDDNMNRNDKKERSRDIHQTMKIISFKDNIVVSRYHMDIVEGMYQEMVANNVNTKNAQKKLGININKEGVITIANPGKFSGAIKNYMKLNEADAMAFGMPDLVRDLLFMSSKYNVEKERQWEYEIAYEKLVRSGKMRKADGKLVKKGDPEFRKYEEKELKEAQNIYDKEDPGYIWEVFKPQYFGYGKTDNVMHPVFLKHALQPKFYRHVEGTEFEKLYIAAQKNQIDMIGFESGEKVGNVTNDDGEFTPIYNENGEVNVTRDKKLGYGIPEDMPQQELYMKFYGIQVEQSSVAKKHVVRGTQVTKHVMANFFNNGTALNPEVDRLIKDYNDTLVKMVKLGKESLIKELGLVKTDKGYRTANISRLVTTLQREAQNRDLPDNIINAIGYIQTTEDQQDLKYPFDTLINKDKIDNILNSIVDSRVISEKMSGKSAVQVASTLYESSPRSFYYLKDGVYTQLTRAALKDMTDKDKQSIRMMSSDLQFYRNENGEIKGMEVYISWPYEGITPEELGLKLKNGVYMIPEGGLKGLDAELLKGVGFRIPTSGMNMVESIVIKGFTPRTNGDMIVLPSEIVGKSGSDFDIDKMNLYLPNHAVMPAGKNYETTQFKAFMIADMIKRGETLEYAETMMNSLTIEDLQLINESTYTDEGKLYKKAKTSLSDISKDDKTTEDYAFVKKGLTRYNASLKGKKVIKYTRPGDNTKNALQNKFINIMSELILRPENYAQLVTPNTTANQEKLAEDIKDAKVAAGTKILEDEKSPTYLRTFIGSSSTRERYLTAKRMVGIAALHSSFHILAQVAGLKTNTFFKTDRIKFLAAKGETTRTVNIKLNHYAKEDGGYNLGHRVDTNGELISEKIGETLSGFVDGAKNPFVFDLNLSLNTASIWFYLDHMGVPLEDKAYFFSQPILDDLFTEMSKNKSAFKKINGENLNRAEMFYKVVAPYYDKVMGGNLMALFESAANPRVLNTFKKTTLTQLNKISSEVKSFSKQEMWTAIKDGSKADPALQIAVLMSYFEHEAQAGYLSNFIQAVGYDTRKTKTTQENQLQVAAWERSKEDGFIKNPDAVLDKTFIGEMKIQKEDIFSMFQNFFITLSPDVQKVFEPLYLKINNPDFFYTKEDGINLVNRYQNFVIAYLLHTTTFKNKDGQDETLNTLYKQFFTDESNIPSQLLKYRKSEDSGIADNLVIRELLPLLTDDENKTNNITLFRSKLNTFEINNVIEALNDLKQYALHTADTELTKFVDNLAKFSILQSGLQSSFIDFKKVLSTEVYSDLVKDILNNFKNNPDIDVAQVWKSFHQNNWSNRAIVPKAPYWLKIKNGTILVGSESSTAANDFLVKYVKVGKPDGTAYTAKEMKEMKENKTITSLYKPILFQKTDLTDDKDRIIYSPVPMLGNGNKMLEIYKDPNQESVLGTNNNQLTTKALKGTEVRYMSYAELMGDESKDVTKATEETAPTGGAKTLKELVDKVKSEAAATTEKVAEKQDECNKK